MVSAVLGVSATRRQTVHQELAWVVFVVLPHHVASMTVVACASGAHLVDRAWPRQTVSRHRVWAVCVVWRRVRTAFETAASPALTAGMLR